MNKYEELIYSLIYNCNRELTTEEKKILNQASAIYNTYNNLTDELGCPLEVFVKALKNGIYYDDKFEYPVFILDKDNFKDKNYHLLVTGTVVYLKEYKETFWLKEDKSE